MSQTKPAAAAETTKPETQAAVAAAAVDAAPAKAAPAAKVVAADPKSVRPMISLLANQWKAREAGVWLNTHEVVPNPGTPIEHLADPKFWENVSQRFRPGDTILAFARDGSWYAELLVWDCGQNWAHVGFMREEHRPAFAAAPGSVVDFDIRRDPIDGYQVIRRGDGVKVKGGFSNGEDARRWIGDYQRALRN